MVLFYADEVYNVATWISIVEFFILVNIKECINDRGLSPFQFHVAEDYQPINALLAGHHREVRLRLKVTETN